MNLFILNSSIGRKLVMSITGLFLVLFLTFHMCMNIVALFSAEAYNMICEFLGANWYALVGTAVLAAGFIIHIIYALVLTIQNRKARGNDRYEVTSRPKSVEWASQNMLALGIVVLAGLVLHLSQFWYKMQFTEIAGITGNQYGVADGYNWMQFYFSNLPVVICYLVWFAAIWFHLSHGFWSALQSMGLDNKTWFNRVKYIGIVYSSILMAGFAIVVIAFFIKSLCC